MDFIVDNYVWFIVGGVIILMAVIGYIADKTDFGRNVNKEKPKKEKKVKKKNKKINDENIDNSNNNVQYSTDNVNVSESTQNNEVNNENIDQSLFAPLTDNVNEVIPQTNEVVENNELKNVEPANLENSIQENNNQSINEDEDIWKF